MKLYKSPYNKIVKSKKYGYLLFAGNTGTIKSIRLMDEFCFEYDSVMFILKNCKSYVFSKKSFLQKKAYSVMFWEKSIDLFDLICVAKNLQLSKKKQKSLKITLQYKRILV